MEIKYSVAKPDLNGNEEKYLLDCLKSGVISSNGEYVKRFEDLFAAKHNMKYGVACSSGTMALLLALRACGIKDGDEVIVPDFTMIASAWAVTYSGATPIFADVDDRMNLNTYQDNLMQMCKVEEYISKNTKAIMPVHIYGRQADMDKILEIAHDYNLFVIEDSCEAHGIPPRGDIACFSLFGNKIITAGEGGICLTNNEKLAEQLRHLRGMAFAKEHTFFHKKLAYNFRMTNMQAAVALAQTERLEEFLAKRKQIETWYDEKLEGTQGIKIHPKRDVVWMYDISTTVKDRDPLREYLTKNGIETRLFFKPMTMQPMYLDLTRAYSQNAFKWSLIGFYLPTYIQLEEKDIDYITDTIKRYFMEKSLRETILNKPSNPPEEPTSTYVSK